MRVEQENKFVGQRKIIENFETKYRKNINMQSKERICYE